MLRLSLITASNRQPDWVDQGAEDYAKRLRGRCTLEIKTVPLARRTASTPVERAIDDEGERMLAARAERRPRRGAARDGQAVVDEGARGQARSAGCSAARRSCFLVGGPDGLSPACVARANERWSLSNLTLPHGLVRVVVAEALYRAWSLLENHPYHRA